MSMLNAAQLATVVQMGAVLRFLAVRTPLVDTWLFSPATSALYAALCVPGLVVHIDQFGAAQLLRVGFLQKGTFMHPPCGAGLRAAASWLCSEGWGAVKRQ